MLAAEKLILIVAYNLSKSEKQGLESVGFFVKDALNKGYKVIGMSASGAEDINVVKNEYGLPIDFYFCDETALKTMIRSNPGIIHLEKGVVKQKLHWNDTSKFKL